MGLLGGSVGLAIRATCEAIERVGIGRRRASLNRAFSCDAIDRGTLSFSRGLRGADLVVLATPLGRFPEMFQRMADVLPDGCIVTDVGSTKGQVVRWAGELLPKHVRFVGSHPMAGSEKTGVEYARADLFVGAPCLVTPMTDTDPKAVRQVKAFWTALGGQVRSLTPEAHDAAMAEVSHLPHALASVLVGSISSSRLLRLAATGFQDTTRIASGDPELWRGIFMTNRACTVLAMDAFIDRLKTFRQALDKKDEDTIVKMLREAKARRDKWIASKYEHREVQA